MSDKTFHQRVAEIQSKLRAPKGQFNKFGNYKYRSCEDVLTAVKPLLDGLVLTISDRINIIGQRIYVVAKATISDGVDSISTEAYAREAEDAKGMSPAQVTGAASSYARKYCLNGLFAIDDTKDDDSINTHGKDQKATTSGDDMVFTFGKFNGRSLSEFTTDVDLKDLGSWRDWIAKQPIKDKKFEPEKNNMIDQIDAHLHIAKLEK